MTLQHDQRHDRQREHFESIFAVDDDPWRFRSRWYEARKRDITLAMLPAARYASGYEPGCANGELSAALATRCDRLLASDGASNAVEAARRRLDGLSNVSVIEAWVPAAWPDGRFDLVVISELAYYLSVDELNQLCECIRATLQPGGTVLACHWRRPLDGCASSGDGVHLQMAQALRMPHLAKVLDADFRLDVWCEDGRSVGQLEGLA